MTITARPKVPKRVLWGEVSELVAATLDTRPLLGLGTGERPVYLDLDNPHLAISAGSGAGKSVLAATVLTQALHRGALARATDRSWAMLARQITPISPRTRIPARWHMVTGDDVAEVQVAYATDQQARSCAAAGVVSQSQPPAVQAPDRYKQLGHVATGATPVGLREALPQLPGPALSLAAIRKAVSAIHASHNSAVR